MTETSAVRPVEALLAEAEAAAAEAGSIETGEPPFIIPLAPIEVPRLRLEVGPALGAAVARATAATGIKEGVLLAIAAAESNLRMDARNKLSTAAGPFQFTEAGWLRAVRVFGASHGLVAEVSRITEARDGTLVVRGRRLKRSILERRYDPHLAAMLAAELARDNARRFSRMLSRQPTDDELYAMHVLGLGRTIALVRAAEAQSGQIIVDILPQAVVHLNAGLLASKQEPPSAGTALSAVQGRYADRFATVNPADPAALLRLGEVARLHLLTASE